MIISIKMRPGNKTVNRTPPLLLLLLIAISLITVILTQQQVAVAHENNNTHKRPTRVEPFDEWASLRCVRDLDTPSSIEAGLGHVLQLNTYMRAKTSESMSTTFHIYRRGKITRDIKFRAKTPATGKFDLAQDYQYNLEMMLESGFDVNKKTVIMIPGYLSDYEEQWARDAMHAWLELYGDDINVVVLSWADSNRCVYSTAVATTPLVARQTSVFLHYLAQLGGTNLHDEQFLSRIHLIGHSLGAHICGFVGQDLGGRVGRITGLDPAGPTFDTYPTDQRLDRSDAQLVEVLHTNAGRMRYMKALSGLLMHAISSQSSSQFQGETTAWFGIDEQIGHIDYYANNGRTQEGCVGSLHICDHGRAGEIYVDMLQYEASLRKFERERDTQPEARKLSRLWAFRADDYKEFQGGGSFFDHCRELVQVESHLNTTQVAESFKRCAVPLLDFLTPVGELARELRDEFHVNLDKDAAPKEQLRYYFRTQMSTAQPRFVSDHYLLKVHLDRESTRWDPSVCTLSAHLYLDDGEKISFELSAIDRLHAFMAAPFAHTQGPEAHIRLQELQASLEDEPASHSDKFAQLFGKLFPRTISLGFATLAQSGAAPNGFVSGASNCIIGIKQIEVHPVSIYSARNLGALYGGRPLLPGQDLEFVSTSKLKERLANIVPTVLSFGHMNSLGVSLESVVVSG